MRSSIQLFLLLSFTAVMAAGCEDHRQEITTIEQANSGRIGVMTGTTGETIAKSRLPRADIKSFDDVMDAVAALNSGQLDGIVTAFPTALQVTKKNSHLRILDETLADEDSSVALRKGDSELLQKVDAIISELQADGTLRAMGQRWFKSDLSPYDTPEIDQPTAGGAPLKIGVAATREPMSFIDADGHVSGHDGELARRIALKLGRPIEFLNMKFMALIPALQSGKIDMIVTGMTATEERRKSVSFSAPYFANSQVLLVRQPSNSENVSADVIQGPARQSPIQNLDGFNQRMAVLMGSAHETYATKTYPNAQILQFKSSADVVLAIKSRKADVALFDADPLQEVMRLDDSFALVGEPLFSFDVGVGFAQDNIKLRDAFNGFLADLKSSGLYAQIVERWMVQRETSMPSIELPANTEPIIVGTSDSGLPFGAVMDNQLVGFDIELVTRFAKAHGRSIEFRNMEFGSLVAAVASGKVDMIAASIYVTDERKARISFSDPYYKMDTRAFTLKADTEGLLRSTSQVEQSSFWSRTVASFKSNVLDEQRYLLLWEGLKTTVTISIFSTLLGTVMGGFVCYMRMSANWLLNRGARAYIALFRGTPVLVLLMLIFYVVFASVPIDPLFVAVIAFGLNFAAYVAEIFRTGIQSIDKGQTEAGIAMGFSRVATFRLIVLPQTIQRILPVYKGEFISLVKMTSIVGYIAVQDLTKASDIIRSRTFDAFFPLVLVAILYFLISWTLMQVLEYLERATDPKHRRKKAAVQ